MKLTPTGSTPPSPGTISMNTNQTHSGINPAARAKAITMIQGIEPEPQSTIQEHPVQNPSQVSPEELTAIKSNSNPSEMAENSNSEVEATPQTPEKVEKKPDPALSRQFAQLARQEKALRQQAQAIKQKELELKEKELQLQANSNKIPSNYVSIDDLKKNTLTKLLEAGITYDDLTQQILNTPGTTDPRAEAAINRLEAKIKALEEAAENSQKSYKESQDEAYKAAVRQIEVDVRQLVKNDPNYETIRATNSLSDVVELITQTYEQDKILLSVEEACQQVEDYLVEEALKFTRIGKIKSRLEQSAQSARAPQKTQAQQQQTQPTMKTLTNAVSSQRKLTAKERAVLAFRGELKS